MAFSKPSVKDTIVDISQARIYIRSVKKFGKTTLFKDLVLEKYGDASCGVLVGIGNELGYKLLKPLNTTQVEKWEDLLEFKDWVLSDDEDAKKIKIIGFDTIDELIPIIESHVCSLSEKKTRKVCNSINEAFGGFQRGQDLACSLLKEFFFDLYKSGKGIFAIAHTKMKTIRDKGSETTDGYQTLTSNLSSKYESVFGDIFDFVFTGSIDREIVDGVATDEVRKLYFRGNTRIDAGGRFAPDSVPEYMVFDGKNIAKEFIETVEEGMRLSGEICENDYAKYKNKVLAEAEVVAEENRKEIISGDKHSEFAEEHGIEFIIKNSTNEALAEKVMEVIAEKNVTKIHDLDIDGLVEIIKYANEKLGIDLEL